MNPGGGGESDLERRLERELARTVRSLRAPSPAPAQAAYHRFAARARGRSLLDALGAASAKLAVGVVAAGLVAAGGVVAATGSPSPTVWGSTVTRAVATCRGSLPSGQRGIGPCVTNAVQQRSSEEQSGQATPDPARGAPGPGVPAVVPTPATTAEPNSGDPPDQTAGHQPSSSPTSRPTTGGRTEGSPPTEPASGSGNAADRPSSEASPACPSSSQGGDPVTSGGSDPATSQGADPTASRGCTPGQGTGDPATSQAPSQARNH